jgi:hypothetical protein
MSGGEGMSSVRDCEVCLERGAALERISLRLEAPAESTETPETVEEEAEGQSPDQQ